MKAKLTSRKFWMMAAAFLGSLGASIAGISSDNTTIAVVGIVCSMLSAAIYAAAEAAVDKNRG
jgi:L-serine deaminase